MVCPSLTWFSLVLVGGGNRFGKLAWLGLDNGIVVAEEG